MQALFGFNAKAQAKLSGNCGITNIERTQEGEAHLQIKRLKKQQKKQGRFIDTLMAARHINTEVQDIAYYLGEAAKSGKHLVKLQPIESETPGLLSPGCVPLNKLLNISELHVPPCVKEPG